uniref:Ig-like domain-containing protein n=1 Tax=Latimeria chalumnae TaxID=7897 RepID=H3ACR7_LATCH
SDAPKLATIELVSSGEIHEGSTLTLTCTAQGNPPVTYSWVQHKDMSWTDKGYQDTLTLEKVTGKDSGNYYCKARNQVGEIYSTLVNINVIYVPKNTNVSVYPLKFKQGDEVVLNCIADSNPGFSSYTWYKDKKWLRREYRATLGFSHIAISDAGGYTCLPENAVGPGSPSAEITLDVLYPPKHTRAEISPKGEIKEGSDVILTCKGDSNPRVNYIWLKDKGRLLESSNLLFITTVRKIRIKLNSSASLVFVSCSILRYERLFISDAPRDTKVVLSTDRIYEGEDVTLRCETQSNSPAHIAWYKNGILYKSSVSALRFKRISRWHSASYSCVVKNLVRRISSEPAHVNVLYAPRNTIVVLSNSLIQEGDDVALTCKTDSNPPAEFTWSKNGIQEMRGSGWTLQLYNVTTQATGNYSCTAVNVVGISTSQPVSLVLSKYGENLWGGMSIACGAITVTVVIIV